MTGLPTERRSRPSDLVSLVEAASLLGVRSASLRAQIHRGRLRAVKLGRDWLVAHRELTRYVETRKRPSTRPD
jgi:excisionase family DNA binding protein